MLTEHERQLLGEIELQLGLTDPRFAARLAGSTRERMLYRLRAWRRPLSLVGMVGGVTLVLLFFASAPLIALVGVALIIAVSLANAGRVAMTFHTALHRAVRWFGKLGTPSEAA